MGKIRSIEAKNLSMMRNHALGNHNALDHKMMDLQEVAEKFTKVVQLLKNLMHKYGLGNLKTRNYMRIIIL